jgi:hypothetical protein
LWAGIVGQNGSDGTRAKRGQNSRADSPTPCRIAIHVNLQMICRTGAPRVRSRDRPNVDDDHRNILSCPTEPLMPRKHRSNA